MHEFVNLLVQTDIRRPTSCHSWYRPDNQCVDYRGFGSHADTGFCQYRHRLSFGGSGHTPTDVRHVPNRVRTTGLPVISRQPVLPPVWSGTDVDPSVDTIGAATSQLHNPGPGAIAPTTSTLSATYLRGTNTASD